MAHDVNGRPEYFRRSCEQSLQRLGVDHINLYHQHRVDPSVPIEDTASTMADLVREGRFSGYQKNQRKRWNAPITFILLAHCKVSIRFGPTKRKFQRFSTCEQLDIGFMAYSPLRCSFLTGIIKMPADFAANDCRRTNPKFMGENFSRNLRLIEKIKQIAREKDCTPAQLVPA